MLTLPKQITVKATRAFTIGGRLVKIGEIATYERTLAAELISNGKAVEITAPEKSEPEIKTDKSAKAEKGDKHAR